MPPGMVQCRSDRGGTARSPRESSTSDGGVQARQVPNVHLTLNATSQQRVKRDAPFRCKGISNRRPPGGLSGRFPADILSNRPRLLLAAAPLLAAHQLIPVRPFLGFDTGTPGSLHLLARQQVPLETMTQPLFQLCGKYSSLCALHCLAVTCHRDCCVELMWQDVVHHRESLGELGLLLFNSMESSTRTLPDPLAARLDLLRCLQLPFQHHVVGLCVQRPGGVSGDGGADLFRTVSLLLLHRQEAHAQHAVLNPLSCLHAPLIDTRRNCRITPQAFDLLHQAPLLRRPFHCSYPHGDDNKVQK
eukprot:Hpha_TRINITY_DN16753_c1_g2::TRINITY_DN16753_c1_g2_i1::g.77666::m.77666